jgi:hypothetical protein
MAVKTGVPIDQLDSLSAPSGSQVAEKVIDAYWQKNGDAPKLFTDRLSLPVSGDRERNQMPKRRTM